MQNLATQQSDNIVPARRGKVTAVAVDATARSYDLTALAFGAAYRQEQTNDYVYLTLTADGASVYFLFNTATASDLDDTAKIAAGSTLAFANTHAQVLPNGVPMHFRIQRNVDKFLQIKCASGSSATLRINASSEPSPGAT